MTLFEKSSYTFKKGGGRKKKGDFEQGLGLTSNIVSFNSNDFGIDSPKAQFSPNRYSPKKKNYKQKNEEAAPSMKRVYMNYEELFVPKDFHQKPKKSFSPRPNYDIDDLFSPNDSFTPTNKKIKTEKNSPSQSGDNEEFDEYKSNFSDNGEDIEFSPISQGSNGSGIPPSGSPFSLFNERKSKKDECFFCHYYSGSNEVKDGNGTAIKLMLKMIEYMFGKCNISLISIGREVEYFYQKEILIPAQKKGIVGIPIVDRYTVIEHFTEHMNINPTIHYTNSFQILYNIRKKLLDNMFYSYESKDGDEAEAGEVKQLQPDKDIINLVLKYTESLHKIQNADPKKSCFFSGDNMTWSLESKGQFLNSGSKITEEHKRNFDRWEDLDYNSVLD